MDKTGAEISNDPKDLIDDTFEFDSKTKFDYDDINDDKDIFSEIKDNKKKG